MKGLTCRDHNIRTNAEACARHNTFQERFSFLHESQTAEDYMIVNFFQT